MSQRANALALMKLWFNVYFHHASFSSESKTDFLSKNFFVSGRLRQQKKFRQQDDKRLAWRKNRQTQLQPNLSDTQDGCNPQVKKPLAFLPAAQRHGLGWLTPSISILGPFARNFPKPPKTTKTSHLKHLNQLMQF